MVVAKTANLERRFKRRLGGVSCQPSLINLIIQLIAGAVGGNAAGAAMKNIDLDTLGNTIAGAIGGAGGGVAGAVVTAVVGLLKNSKVAYAVMALARNTQSKTVMKMESGKSAFAGERSSQRNCLSNSS